MTGPRKKWPTRAAGLAIICASALGGTAVAHADPSAAGPADANFIRGTISTTDGVSVRDGWSDVHQGLGTPEIGRQVPKAVATEDSFSVDGWGPVIDAKWRIYDHGKLTDYWIDAHLTTSIIDRATATCQVTKGEPGKDTSRSVGMSGYNCVWSDYGNIDKGRIDPILRISRPETREVTNRSEQDNILNQYCKDSSNCRYVPESFSDKAIGEEEIVGTPVVNNTNFMTTPQYTWDHAVNVSDTTGGKITGSVSATVFGVLETSLAVEANYAHTWGHSKRFSETVPLPIAPKSIGYVTHQAVRMTTTGYFLVDTGGSTVKLTNRSYAAPRTVPDNNDPTYGHWITGQLNLYNCSLDQWDRGAKECRQPELRAQTQTW